MLEGVQLAPRPAEGEAEASQLPSMRRARSLRARGMVETSHGETRDVGLEMLRTLAKSNKDLTADNKALRARIQSLEAAVAATAAAK